MPLSIRVLALLALLFSTSIAGAADPVSESWQKRTRENIERLKRRDYQPALKVANGVVSDMVARLGPGTVETQSFGIALTHKALALAGLGRKDEALWNWHIALNLYPGLAKTDLSPYGEPGKFLLANAELRKRDDVRRLAEGQPLPTNVTAPVLKKRVNPQYPEAAHAFGISGVTVVEVLVDREGTIRSPLVLKSLPAPTITYAALEAVRQWKFEPGRLDGQPVPTVFNVSINFKLR